MSHDGGAEDPAGAELKNVQISHTQDEGSMIYRCSCRY